MILYEKLSFVTKLVHARACPREQIKCPLRNLQRNTITEMTHCFSVKCPGLGLLLSHAFNFFMTLLTIQHFLTNPDCEIVNLV